jgi:hypothetical protein
VAKLSGTRTSFFMSIRGKISRRHRPDTYVTYADVQALVCCVAPMPLSPTPRPAVPRLGGPAETDPLMHGLRRLNLCATSDLMTWYPGENLVAKLSSCGADRFMSKISSVENVVSSLIFYLNVWSASSYILHWYHIAIS